MIGKKTRRSEGTKTIDQHAEVLGNTKPALRVLRGRSFQITLNQIEKYAEVENYFMGLKNLRYWIACKEKAPTTGHEHIHIYANFKKTHDLRLEKCCGAHVEVCKGSPKENIDYIQKDGNIIKEWGDKPHQGGKTIGEVEKMTPEERNQLPLQYYKIVQQINEKQANKIYVDEAHKDVEVYYIWGPSGVGKSEKAKQIVRDWFKEHRPGEKPFCNYIKCIDKFYHGIGNEQVAAIYDDWRDSHMKPDDFINLIDYNITRLNTKGGGVKNEYKLIIITTVENIKDIYTGMKAEEPRAQWERRLKVIHMEKLKEKDDTGDKNKVEL